MCEKCDQLRDKRDKLMKMAAVKPRPCVVCGDQTIVGVSSWIPDKRNFLAAGGTSKRTPIFAFCLCETHFEQTVENERLIAQAVLREIRTGKNIVKE